MENLYTRYTYPDTYATSTYIPNIVEGQPMPWSDDRGFYPMSYSLDGELGGRLSEIEHRISNLEASMNDMKEALIEAREEGSWNIIDEFLSTFNT